MHGGVAAIGRYDNFVAFTLRGLRGRRASGED
jgi:hypothetical protein